MKYKKLALTGLLGVGLLTATGCSAVDSFTKDIESNTAGLERQVTVYNHAGEVINTYQGIIRTKESSQTGAVIFELDGKRISLYNVDVVIEEVK